jgi:CubicO group peptidase (beta-lactamase class C family)
MRCSFVLLGLLLGAACTRPDTGPTLDPTAAAALDAVLRDAVVANEVPGVVALVTSRDSVLFRAAHGLTYASAPDSLRADAIFRVFSMAKPITSLGVMMLVAEGRIGLDEPAANYLPELAEREVLVAIEPSDSTVVTRAAARPVTVRDLLRHTSGIGYTFSSHELLEWTGVTGRSVLEQPLLHDPGARWTYGASTWFLGEIIARVSGQPLDRFLWSRIFEPLGMLDTSYELPAEKHARLVGSNTRSDGVLRGTPPPETLVPSVAGDGGTLVSTADDYARFIRLVLGQGETEGVRLLGAEWMAEMTRDQLENVTVTEQPGAVPALSAPFPLGAGRDGFGLGFQVAKATGPGERAPGSLSWAGLRNTHFWIDPTNGIGVVLLTQVLPFYDADVIDVLTTFERAVYAHLN